MLFSWDEDTLTLSPDGMRESCELAIAKILIIIKEGGAGPFFRHSGRPVELL